MLEKIGHYSLENTPSVYDEEAMTALELAGRTAQKVNECIDEVNRIPDVVSDTVLGHLESGTFDKQIDEHNQEIIQEINETEASLGARLDALLGSVTPGSTTMDAEIKDARIGANAVNYNNLGTALREQFLLSWKRARNTWTNSPEGTGPLVSFDTIAKTITLNAGSYQGTYSWYRTDAPQTISWADVEAGTYALVLNSVDKTLYLTVTTQNFTNPADILLAYVVLVAKEATRVWADYSVQKHIYIDGDCLCEIKDACLGANGVNYESLGTAIREQFILSWKRSRNIWRNSPTKEPVVIVDNVNKTITLKSTTYQGLYAWKRASKAIEVSFSGMTAGTYALVMGKDGTNAYLVNTTANFNDPADYLIATVYIEAGSVARMWADANVEKLISVDGIPLNETNNSVYQNKHTANIFRKVVCIGDSLTSGHMQNILTGAISARTEDYAYPRFMEKLSGNTYVNCGVSGNTVLSWQKGDGYTMAVNAGQTQAYLIRFMGNDQRSDMEVGTLADVNSDTATTYYGGYGQIIRKMKAISPEAKFFICTDPRTGGRYPQFNEAVRNIANYFDNVYCLDLLANHSLFGAPSFTGDLLANHYTATGYEQMAEIYYHLMSEVINNNPTEFQSVPFIPYT